jgi:hypothetical protein
MNTNPQIVAIGAAVVIGGIGLYMLSRGSGDKEKGGDDSILPGGFLGIGNGGVTADEAHKYGYDVDPNVDPSHSYICLDNSGLHDPNRSALEKGYDLLTPVGWIMQSVFSAKRAKMCSELTDAKLKRDTAAASKQQVSSLDDAVKQMQTLYDKGEYALAYSVGSSALQLQVGLVAQGGVNALAFYASERTVKVNDGLLLLGSINHSLSTMQDAFAAQGDTPAMQSLNVFVDMFKKVILKYFYVVVCDGALRKRRDVYKQATDATTIAARNSLLDQLSAMTQSMTDDAVKYALTFVDPDPQIMDYVTQMRNAKDGPLENDFQYGELTPIEPLDNDKVVSDLVHVTDHDEWQSKTANYVKQWGMQKMAPIFITVYPLRDLYFTFIEGSDVLEKWYQGDAVGEIKQKVMDAFGAYRQLPLYVITDADFKRQRRIQVWVADNV